MGEVAALLSIWVSTWNVVRRLAAVVAVVIMALAMAAPSLAEPETPEDPGQAPAPTEPVGPVGGAVVDSPTLSLEDLGETNLISFYRGTSVVSLAFPVPAGLVPSTLNATLDLPFNMRSGVVTVTQDDRVISKQPLPLADLTPLVIPLPGVQIIDDSVALTLTITSLPEDGYCLDWFNPIQLINGSVTFTGAEVPPTTVADFLPPILRKLTIAIPSNPSQAESSAAVQLAARITKRYGGQAPAVDVIPLPDGATSVPTPSAPLERQVIIKEGTSPVFSLVGTAGVPQLLISGPSDALNNLGLMLATSMLDLAVSPQVIPEKVRSIKSPDLPGDAITLGALGEKSGLTSAGLSPQVTIGINQTQFGRSIQGIRVHVLGTYTPIPNNFGAHVNASIDGQSIDTWATDPGGTIDHWVQIPDRMLSRYTQLQIGVNTTGDFGGCNDFRPITLTIHDDTVIETTTATPPIPAGFGSLPQALMPIVRVGIGDDKFADTARAARIVVGLQRLGALPLQTVVTSIDEARKSRDPAVLVSANGWTDKSIALPVSANDNQITVQGQGGADDSMVLTLDPGVQFGSLQTVFDGHRTLLIATSNGAPAQLDDLLNWLSADRNRWSQLRGNAIIDIMGRQPELVRDRMPATVYGPPGGLPIEPSAAEGGYRGSPAWWIAALVVGAAAAGAGVIAWSSLRSGSDRSSSSSSHRRGE